MRTERATASTSAARKPCTRRQTRVDRLEIFSPELQEVFAEHMIPHLSLRSLMAVACTCKALRNCAYLRDEPWRLAAPAQLPPGHPPLSQDLDRAGCGKFVAALMYDDQTHEWSHISIFSVHDGTQLWQMKLSSIKESFALPVEVYWIDMRWYFGPFAALSAILTMTWNVRCGPFAMPWCAPPAS
ncbi:hypothetical protein WJX73_004460 [Symbiochloris irregularis]|uniref:F-box domain-containing protein n=1 Tax=Symbiochloris irregularis TaxID=706552 RepID=A0AAW1P361_9CHLO